MYPETKSKSDRERFRAFKEGWLRAGGLYVRRKLASGMNEEELPKLCVTCWQSSARRASCMAIRYGEV